MPKVATIRIGRESQCLPYAGFFLNKPIEVHWCISSDVKQIGSLDISRSAEGGKVQLICQNAAIVETKPEGSI